MKRLMKRGRRKRNCFMCFMWMSLLLLWGMAMMVPAGALAGEPVLHYYDKLLDVSLLESGQIWVVGHAGKLIHSENFGKDWVSQDAGTLKGLFSVCFVTPEKGWISGELGQILHTEDGGKTWAVQGEGVTTLPLLMIRFLNENVGWATGSVGTILKTHDGGKTWVKSGYSRDMAFNDLYIFNENKLYAACEFDNVMMTEDGGETWKALMEEGFGEPGNFFGIDFIDENRGFAVGTGGNIKYTMDAGATWQTAENNETKKTTLMKVKFFDDKTGVAIGLDGAMVFTKDGGLTWDPPSPITQFTWFSGLSILKDGRGVVVGVGNVILTSDFGKTWTNPIEDVR